MTKSIGGVPVRSRVPLAAWAFAGQLALLSLLSSLLHVAAGPDGHLGLGVEAGDDFSKGSSVR